MWLEGMEISDLRNIREVALELKPGLNVFVGGNAQGKTTLLEAAALLARGRSFRTDETGPLVRRGAEGLRARGRVRDGGGPVELEVELRSQGRRFRVDGREVAPARYQGQLEAVVYATDRLRIVRGPMRERRLLLDRGAAALWPAYRRELRDYERALAQRNAALEGLSRDIRAWDEQIIVHGARVRTRRAEYGRRLQQALRGAGLEGEAYAIAVVPDASPGDEAAQREALRREIETRGAEERRRRRSLAGPHRDDVRLTVGGEPAETHASSGQARSLLLALTLAAAEVYRAERGSAPVALLDDLDSELDEARTDAVCRTLAGRGQALVTTAHPAWAHRLAGWARVFEVRAGRVKAKDS